MRALSTESTKSLEALDFAPEAECRAVAGAVARELGGAAGPDLAAEAVAVVMQLYSAKDMTNPEAFLEYAVMSLVDFPEAVVVRLADPRHGIARECKFLPSIAELVQWCETETKRLKSLQDKVSHRLVQLARRAELQRGPIINGAASKGGFQKLSWSGR